MKKELATLAKKMQVLKKEDKEDFLERLRNCAILFDPKEPKSIPSCPVQEGMGYKIDLIRSLYRKLEGEAWMGEPKPTAYALASKKKLKRMYEQELRQRAIYEGVNAYCRTDAQDRNHFEHIVRKIKWLAPFLRKKDRVLDYDFR